MIEARGAKDYEDETCCTASTLSAMAMGLIPQFFCAGFTCSKDILETTVNFSLGIPTCFYLIRTLGHITDCV